MSDVFTPPPVNVGDSVLWYSDPMNPNDPCAAHVVKVPGRSTLTLLVFSEDTGWAFRPSVRHRDDPGLLENPQWRQWGCWEYSKQTETLKKIDSVLPQLAQVMARSKKD